MSEGRGISVATEKQLKAQKTLIYTHVNKKKSSYQKQSYMNEEKPTTGIFKDSSKFCALPTESSVNLGEDEGRAATMYIPNGPTIFKDDLWLDKEGNYHTTMSISEADAKAQGWEFKTGLITRKYIDTEGKLAQWRKQVKKLELGFRDGIMILDGKDANLQRFVESHHQNVKSQKYVQTSISLFLFSSLEEEKIAEAEIGPIEIIAEVTNLIANLRTSKGKTYVYTAANKAKINAILSLLDMSNFQDENYNQKHLAINNFALSNPVNFMQIVEDAFNEKKLTIATALNDNIKIIIHDKKEKAFMMIVGEKDKLPIKRELAKSESADYDTQIEELVIHLINNPTNWRDLTLLIDAAKTK